MTASGSRIAEIARRHKRIAWGKDVCICEEPWPCDASTLAAMLTPERVAAALHEFLRFEQPLRYKEWATRILAALEAQDAAIVGYANPDGSGKGNWSSDNSDPLWDRYLDGDR